MNPPLALLVWIGTLHTPIQETGGRLEDGIRNPARPHFEDDNANNPRLCRVNEFST